MTNDLDLNFKVTEDIDGYFSFGLQAGTVAINEGRVHFLTLMHMSYAYKSSTHDSKVRPF